MPLFPPSSPPSAGASRTAVAATGIVTTLLAANQSRLQASFYNDSTVGSLYLALGAGAAFTDYTVRLEPQEMYELPYRYVGLVTGIWNVVDLDAFAYVTELT